MNNLYIFIIRMLVGGLLAVILTKIFRPDAGLFQIICFGAILVGLAYGLEYIRKRKSNG